MTSLFRTKIDSLPRTAFGVFVHPILWRVLGRAAVELALARWRLGRRQVRDLLGTASSSSTPSDKTISPERADILVARVAWAVPRIAARVPWRADCLVQATAAQHWLSQKGVRTHLHIGVRKDRPAGFEAHAWLCHSKDIVTGGDISGFTPLEPPPNP